MGEVYIYAPDASDLSGIGYGPLRPSSCVSRHKKNDFWTLDATVPMWADNRNWEHIQPGALVRALVPMRVMPDINMDDPDHPLRVTTVQVWRVRNTATYDERTLWRKADTDHGKIRRFKIGKKVTIIKSVSDDWYKVNTNVGKGFMLKSGLEFEIQTTVPDTNQGIETVLEPVRLDYQTFRITKVTRGIGEITFAADCKWYDLAGVLTYYTAGKASAGAAIKGVLDGCMSPQGYDFVTDTGDVRNDLSYDGVNPVFAILDPDEGIAAKYDLELVRSDTDFALLRHAGANRGGVIEYGKNMVSMRLDTDTSDVITHIIPVGRGKKGKKLYLNDTRYVVSPLYEAHPERYPVPVWQEIEYTNQGCQVTDEITAAQVRAELARLAAAEFSKNHIDEPTVRAKVKFVDIGETVGYEQYKGLDRAYYLYDWVRLIYPEQGVDVEAEIVEETFDCLAEIITDIELDSVRSGARARKISSWEVPQISGDTIITGTIPAGKLEDGAVTDETLSDGAVTEPKIEDKAVSSAKIALLAVGEAQIANLAVTAAKIANAAITSAKIQDAAIGTAQIALGAITTALIQAGAVGTAQIADASITDAKVVDLSANSITAGTLAVERLVVVGGTRSIVYTINEANGTAQLSQTTIDGGALTQRSITADRIVAGAITTRELAAASVLANNIAAGAITADKVDIVSLFAAQATIDAINTMDISSNQSLRLAVSNISVGGRNYLRNSEDLKYSGYAQETAPYFAPTVGTARAGLAVI